MRVIAADSWVTSRRDRGSRGGCGGRSCAFFGGGGRGRNWRPRVRLLEEAPELVHEGGALRVMGDLLHELRLGARRLSVTGQQDAIVCVDPRDMIARLQGTIVGLGARSPAGVQALLEATLIVIPSHGPRRGTGPKPQRERQAQAYPP